MGILDWFLERRREREALDQFREMEEEYDSVQLPEGQITGEGGVACPHCRRSLSLTEYLGQRSVGAVAVLTCPNCRKEFKCH